MDWFGSNGYNAPILPGILGRMQEAGNQRWRTSVFDQNQGNPQAAMETLVGGGDPHAQQLMMANSLNAAAREDRQSHDVTMFNMRQEAAREAALADAKIAANAPQPDQIRAFRGEVDPLIKGGNLIQETIRAADGVREMPWTSNLGEVFNSEEGRRFQTQYTERRNMWLNYIRELEKMGALQGDEYERLQKRLPDITPGVEANWSFQRVVDTLAIHDAEMRADLQNRFTDARGSSEANVWFNKSYNDALSDAQGLGMIDENMQPTQVNYEALIHGEGPYAASQQPILPNSGGAGSGQPLALPAPNSSTRGREGGYKQPNFGYGAGVLPQQDQGPPKAATQDKTSQDAEAQFQRMLEESRTRSAKRKAKRRVREQQGGR